MKVKLDSSIRILELQKDSRILNAVIHVMIHQPSHEDLDAFKHLLVKLTIENKNTKKLLKLCMYQKDFGVDAAFCIFTNENYFNNTDKIEVFKDFNFTNEVSNSQKHKTEDFEHKDSGTCVVDQKGKAFGIFHTLWMMETYKYAITSPYFAVFKALDVESEKASSSAD
ncbi:19387_t:CDS:2 [Funneliformis geosporum]|uniref:1861_t:CDS:1 n=1 Tax=Funneliformis geosporum TaxID=1117311 RepID=A0A9W4SA96_9GLOM|nr:19387_t:CDS:2 [Funneliformis geosporum]CAI2162493.1 1861_t:CDS:2 [Funneliformis geosporum]